MNMEPKITLGFRMEVANPEFHDIRTTERISGLAFYVLPETSALNRLAWFHGLCP
jgi:hypothetical protein